MTNLFTLTPSRKPHTFYLSGRIKNVLHAESGMRRIAEHFEFDMTDTVDVHKCKHVFDQVLICCQLSGKRHDDANEFEEAFQLFRKSHKDN